MLKKCFRPVLSGIFIGLMLVYPQNSTLAARHALASFASGVLPALFPFTACMLLLTAGRAFPLPVLLTLSLLGGSPTGARILSEAAPDPAAARRLARATGTMSPMFFLSTMPFWLGSEKQGLLLLGCHLFSAIIFAVPLLRCQSSRIMLPPLSISAALLQSAQAMLTVAGCITLGSVGARLVCCLFPHLPALPLALLQSAFEVTSGSQSLIAAAPDCLLPLLCFFTAFSGLSILLQNAAFWGKQGVTLTNLTFFGLLRGGIAFLICFAILLCLPGGFAV